MVEQGITVTTLFLDILPQGKTYRALKELTKEDEGSTLFILYEREMSDTFSPVQPFPKTMEEAQTNMISWLEARARVHEVKKNKQSMKDAQGVLGWYMAVGRYSRLMSREAVVYTYIPKFL